MTFYCLEVIDCNRYQQPTINDIIYNLLLCAKKVLIEQEMFGHSFQRAEGL